MTRYGTSGSTVFDYLALLAALRAVGAEPQPSLILLAYTAGELLGLLPFTPGAVLLFRLVSYWLPLFAGGVAYLLFRHRYGSGAMRG